MRPPFYALFSESGTLRAGTSSYKQDRGGEQVAAEYFGNMVWVDKQRRKPNGYPLRKIFSIFRPWASSSTSLSRYLTCRVRGFSMSSTR